MISEQFLKEGFLKAHACGVEELVGEQLLAMVEKEALSRRELFPKLNGATLFYEVTRGAGALPGKKAAIAVVHVDPVGIDAKEGLDLSKRLLHFRGERSLLDASLLSSAKCLLTLSWGR